jgi:hydroxymethylpyrimidine kinase/phosphomethylpyrimidine kinase
VGAQYPALQRGLTADVLSAHGLGATPYTVCTSHVVAGHGVVTDVLEVPSDTVSAQLEHIFQTSEPTAAKVGITGSSASAGVIFRHLRDNLDGPVVLDLTLSGPSGEDIAEQSTIDVILDNLDVPEIVTASLMDASLLARMEIPSLDDAQVAAQRIGQQGAKNVLLRCGRLPTHFFDTESEPPNYAVDLFYDGDELAVFEAPHVEGVDVLSGRASALLMSALHGLSRGRSVVDALRGAKAVVTEALRETAHSTTGSASSVFFDALHHRILSDVEDS